MSDLPWWFPCRADEEYCARIREEYEDAADMDDDEIREEYAHGEFEMLWDHLGDARSSYEPLAESYLELLASHKALVSALQAVMLMDVRGHQLQDRLQFSDAGRAILEQFSEALAQAEKVAK